MKQAVKAFRLIFLAPFALVVLGVIYCELNKAYWDHRIKEMCEKNGGVTVFEKVEISKADYPSLKFTSNGHAIFPPESHANQNTPFYYTFKTEYLKKGSPDVMRFEQSIIRSKDKKALSTHISYARSGGDFPDFISYPSSYSCGDTENDLHVYESTITIM